MSVTGIDANAPKNDEEKAAIAEFEAAMPPAMRTELGLVKMWHAIGLLCDFTAPTLERLDKLQTSLMRRVFDKRDRSILIDGDVHPLIDKKTGRPVQLVDDWNDFAEAFLWAMRVDPKENQAALERGYAIRTMCRWLRWNVGHANRVAIGLCTFVRVFVELPDELKEAYATIHAHRRNS